MKKYKRKEHFDLMRPNGTIERSRHTVEKRTSQIQPLDSDLVGEWKFTLQPCDDQSHRNTITWREGGQD